MGKRRKNLTQRSRRAQRTQRKKKSKNAGLKRALYKSSRETAIVRRLSVCARGGRGGSRRGERGVRREERGRESGSRRPNQHLRTLTSLRPRRPYLPRS